jgi:uncharacterized protein YqeY
MSAPPDDPLPRIQADATLALKAGDKDRVSVLRMLAADLKRAAIDAGTDTVVGADAVAILRRAVKTRADAADQYAKAGRADLAEKERREIAVVEGYLPKGPSEDEVRAVARTVIAEKGAKGPAAMGTVMKETLGRLGGGADGKVVSRVVGELLRGG